MLPALMALKQMGGSASNEELLGKGIKNEATSEDSTSQPQLDPRQTKLKSLSRGQRPI
ncbi:hypothetical protein GCM10011322_40020 [Salinarimonas ramus]|uniref:Uncharacterized protein n=1 Tax=Salinarimonas ramus TaxID=690164 RepID=A0A917V8H7_9HYPH|nr:hypothetical protein GCM10011322_40020 [Salinarimonas ramus]